MKKILYNILALTLTAFLLTACSAGNSSQQLPLYTNTAADSSAVQQGAAASADTAQSNVNQASAASDKVFTKDELSKYDGKNGNPAYIAVNGVVYDVTNVPQWRNGQHNGRYNAGMDLTEAFKTESPHDSSIFNGVPVVGKYGG